MTVHCLVRQFRTNLGSWDTCLGSAIDNHVVFLHNFGGDVFILNGAWALVTTGDENRFQSPKLRNP